MKRIEQLQPLSKEHHLSLVLAQKAIKIAKKHNKKDIALLCQNIVNEYPTAWRIHFKIEEESIFSLFNDVVTINQEGNEREIEISTLCQQLQQEHHAMNNYYEQMKSGNYSVLQDFGKLLKQHTRSEERQLFPLLDIVLKPAELDSIYETSLKYR